MTGALAIASRVCRGRRGRSWVPTGADGGRGNDRKNVVGGTGKGRRCVADRDERTIADLAECWYCQGSKEDVESRCHPYFDYCGQCASAALPSGRGRRAHLYSFSCSGCQMLVLPYGKTNVHIDLVPASRAVYLA